MDKKNFVEGTMSETFSNAFRWIDHLEYSKNSIGDEIVHIVCNNGYKYNVNVTMDSLGAIIMDVTKEASRH